MSFTLTYPLILSVAAAAALAALVLVSFPILRGGRGRPQSVTVLSIGWQVMSTCTINGASLQVLKMLVNFIHTHFGF